MAPIAATFVLTALAGLASAQLYLIDMGSHGGGDFCGGTWRDGAVAVAGSMCTHHVIQCTEIGNNKAHAVAWHVPFINSSPGHCFTADGPASGPKTDDTYQVAAEIGGGVHVISQLSGAPGHAAAPAPVPHRSAPKPHHESKPHRKSSGKKRTDRHHERSVAEHHSHEHKKHRAHHEKKPKA